LDLLDSLLVYLPEDRRQALARGEDLPERPAGTALFADISGFTPLTEALVRDFGHRRGAEELTRVLNQVYDALIARVHTYGGCVIGFSGDAITCWFDGDTALRASACALEMQAAMPALNAALQDLLLRAGRPLALKTSLACGEVRRFLVGDPEHGYIDVMAGALLDRLAAADHLTGKGEVLIDPAAAAELGDQARIAEWRTDSQSQMRCAVLDGLRVEVPPAPWPPLQQGAITPEQIRPWLPGAVYRRLVDGQGDFLAELRPAAALFLRFSGLDYEAAGSRGQLDDFIRQVQEVIARYDGTLIQLTIGDKGSYLYAVFGAPLAHEDDPLRAAAAAVDLRRIAAGIPGLQPVQIGLTWGRMRTGAYGSPLRRTYGVLGDQTNLAARLMQAAQPGEIYASQEVVQATGEFAVWQALPPLQVKGVSEPVPVFRLESLQEIPAARLQHAVDSLPLVGRAAELALGLERLALAKAGRGQVLGVCGEAGIGKSRLIAELSARAAAQGFTVLGGECQSYGTDSSYLVWQGIVWGLFDLQPGWSAEQLAAALHERLAALDPDLVARLPLLGDVLNQPLPDNELTRSLDPKLRKTARESLVVDCLRLRAQAGPLLLVLEECHWLDPLSQDLLVELVRLAAGLPLVVLLGYRLPPSRPSPVAPIADLPHFKEITLSPFNSEEAQRLIELKMETLFHGTCSPELIAQITEHAEGNPFYLEELVNYLRDRGLDPGDLQTLQQVELPDSLHSLILSRIDQLNQREQITLKLASVIGRLFRASLLWGAYPELGTRDVVQVSLHSLARSELVLPDNEAELTYFFKHIITQEVAYESLPFETRAVLHARIGTFIETTFPAALDQYLDLLAFHYSRSYEQEKQRHYLRLAGEAAQARYANASAIRYYEDLLPLLPPDEQVPVLLRLGRVYELVGEWAQAAEIYGRGLETAGSLGDQAATARCLAAAGELDRKQGRFEAAAQRFEQALELFNQLGDEEGAGQVYHYLGTLAAQQGDYAAASERYLRSLEIRRRLQDEFQTAALLSNLGIVARFQGDYPRARQLHEESLALRRKLGDRWAIAVSLNNLGNVVLDQGDLEEARLRLEEALALMREVGARYYIANSLNNLGNVVRALGDYPRAAALYRESLLLNRELGDGWQLAYVLEDIGVLAALRGDPGRALRLVEAAAALRERIGAPLSPAEQEKLTANLAPALQGLAADDQEALRRQGRALSLDEAAALALE